MNRGSFSFRVTMFTLVFAVAAMGCFSYINIKTIQKILLDTHIRNSMDMSELVSRMIRNAVIIHDYQFLGEVPETIAGISGHSDVLITECSILSADNRYIVHSNPALEGTSLDDKDIAALINKAESMSMHAIRNTEDGKEFIVVSAIAVGGIKWGHVILKTSLEPLNRTIGMLAIRSVVAIVLLSVSVLFIVYGAVRRNLAPLNRLNSRLRGLVDEGKTEKLHYESEDELGDLIQSVNSMMDNWRALYEDSVQRRQEADTQRQFSDAVVENIANGILVLDHDGLINRANRSVEKNTSVPVSELLGKQFWQAFPGWENESTQYIFRKVMETGEIYSNERIYYRAEDTGREIVFNVSICPMKDPGQAILGAVVFFEFMTEKVLMEEHLFKANEELKRANELKSEFLSMVSHELRTPLTLIKMYSSMLEQKKMGPLTQRQEKAVEVMSRRCRNLHELIDDLLDLSKIESGRLELQLQEFNLEELVEETAGGYAPRAQDLGLEFSFRVQENMQSVLGDREKIARVLTNLLDNALKFTEDGSITLKAGIDPDNSRQAKITVQDTGCGIPEEHSDKVFQKFYQVDGSDTRKHGGSGLGLSIASEIVALHQGALSIEESTPGVGTRFSFTLPFTHPDILKTLKGRPLYVGGGGVKEETGAPLISASSEKRVLLIDDDQDFLDMMSDVLVEDGFTVYSATDGLEGIELLFTEQPVDVILLDVTMPLISGYELCRMIKALQTKKDIPVLMLTAAGQSEQIKNGYAAGAAGYLVKPFTLEVFRETLYKIMREE